jgi:hypothetical protein
LDAEDAKADIALIKQNKRIVLLRDAYKLEHLLGWTGCRFSVIHLPLQTIDTIQ